ncbi:hypothetical protein Z947_2770 [Sulfitobacter geojensis]|nr:hypothetical protein Z947_2770 [Sulfitobacter geojensis]
MTLICLSSSAHRYSRPSDCAFRHIFFYGGPFSETTDSFKEWQSLCAAQDCYEVR